MNNNKLIAEFMGYEVKHGKCYSPKYNDGTIAPMQFDRSWDWLMPVVVKCFDVFDENDLNDDLNFKLNDALLETNIDSLYEAVVEFIKEYNNERLRSVPSA